MKKIAEIALHARDRAAIDEAAALPRKRLSVLDVILFGSKARGDDDSESDIDLLVLTSRELSWSERHAITDALFPLQLRHEVVLSLLILPAREWESGVASVLPIHDEISNTVRRRDARSSDGAGGSAKTSCASAGLPPPPSPSAD
jgi:predicted nucleotidyltransferase